MTDPTPAGESSGPTVDILGPTPSRRGGRRGPWLIGGALATALAAGGVAWGVTWYSSDGAQAAEAVPADAIAYVGLTLDPSGEQKLDALRTFKKFPDLKRELDLGGDVGDVDLNRTFAQAVLGGLDCPGVSVDDVDGWLGERAGLAALPGPDGDGMIPLVTLEVTSDDDAARDLDDLVACVGDDELGVAVSDGWAAFSDSEAHARAALDDAAKSSLADDDGFQRWTSEAGDRGVVTGYLSPEAPRVLLGEAMDAYAGLLGGEAVGGADPRKELDKALDRFPGAGLQARFDGGGLSVDLVTAGATVKGSGAKESKATTSALAQLGGLPQDTAAAIAAAGGTRPQLSDAELQQLDDAFKAGVRSSAGPLADALPSYGDIVEAIQGGLVASVGRAFFETQGDELPAAVKVPGDGAGITGLIDELESTFGFDSSAFVTRASRDGSTAVGTDPAYVQKVLADGDLRDSKRFSGVLEGAGSPVLALYADLATIVPSVDDSGAFDALSAAGLTFGVDDGIGRVRLRITTE